MKRATFWLVGVQAEDNYQPPYWLLQSIDDDQDEVTLEDYLMPFDISWARRFLEGLPPEEEVPVSVEPQKDEEVLYSLPLYLERIFPILFC